MGRRIFAILFAVLCFSASAFAVEPGEMLADPALEERARVLSKTLRCMVCQNQSIDDSAAPLAHDLRVLVRERIKAGDSDREVQDYLVARYGEFVLLEPRLSAHTILLWAVPGLILLIGGAAIFLMRRRMEPRLAALSREEERKLAKLTKEPE